MSEPHPQNGVSTAPITQPANQPLPSLGYAPPPKSQKRWVWVIVAGIFSTALTLIGASLLNHYTKGDFNIIGFYYAGVFPIGALGLGIAAASGYTIAAWLLGCRPNRRLMLLIAGICLLAYFSMHFIEFKSQGPLVFKATGQRVTFWQYYDISTRSMRFVSTDSTPSTPEPSLPGSHGPSNSENDQGLGLWGYAVRVGEIAAFSVAAIFLPWIVLHGRIYCELCERYHTTIRLATLPGSVPVKKRLGIFRPSKVRLDGPHAVEGQKAMELSKQLADMVAAGDIAAFNQKIAELKPGSKKASRLPRRVVIVLSRCKQCGQGILNFTMATGIDARNTRRDVLCTLNLEREATDAIRPR
jgi:hypothetical protein